MLIYSSAKSCQFLCLFFSIKISISFRSTNIFFPTCTKGIWPSHIWLRQNHTVPPISVASSFIPKRRFIDAVGFDFLISIRIQSKFIFSENLFALFVASNATKPLPVKRSHLLSVFRGPKIKKPPRSAFQHSWEAFRKTILAQVQSLSQERDLL
jgi:hypothetical protein